MTRNLSLYVSEQLYELVHDDAATRGMTVRKIMEEALEGLGDITEDEFKMELFIQFTGDREVVMRNMTSAFSESSYELLSLAALEYKANRRFLVRLLLRKCYGILSPPGAER